MYFKDRKIYRIYGHVDNYELPQPLNIVSIGKGEAQYDLLEIYAGFDIETTTITTEDGKHLSFVYHFQVSIGTPRILNIYLFRKWDHVIHFFDIIAQYYNLGAKRHIIIGIANMGFEFQFLRKRLKWDDGDWDFFAKEKYKPLRATYHGKEFREVLSITGGSLAQLAKDYCSTQKLVTIDEDGVKHSDLDYKKLRNSKTVLNPHEEAYCINDVVILSEFMWYLFCDYIRPEQYIPMTFTGILHREFKQELKDLCIKRDNKYHLKHGSSLAGWMDFIFSLQPSEAEYVLYFKYLFRGGYVHANALYTDIDGLLADMEDITSHYPTRMNLDYFPMSRFIPVKHDPAKMFTLDEKLIKSKCLIVHCIFDYIRPTTTHTIESKNKIMKYSNAAFDNGRLISADMIEVLLTEKDIEVYRMFYTWAGVTILEAYQADRGELPPYVIDVLNRHYKVKEELKRNGQKDTQEYTIAKARVNTCYGDLVKRLRLVKTLYDNERGWVDDPTPMDYIKECKKAILTPFWGIWVTAGARKELLTVIYKMTKAGIPVYYGDTDSNKHAPCHKAKQIIKHYNNSIKKHRKNRKLRSEFFEGLGEFDRENINKTTGISEPVPFKTLGAKRYLYIEDGKVKATVAGMPKASINQVGSTPEECLKKFRKTGFRLTPEQSGKLTTEYTDEEYSADIDGELMTELSGVALYEIPFTLSLASDYCEHIEELQARFRKEDTVL